MAKVMKWADLHSMIIREEIGSDISQITNIHNQAFGGPDEGRIVEKLRKNNNLLISLVAEVDNKVVGHIAYSPMRNKKGEIIGIGLAPVAVVPGHQKRGIGAKLIEEGNRMALSKGFNKIFVLGDPGYYSRFGFKPAREYNYYSDFDPEAKYFMALGSDLDKAPEKMLVDYCKEFNA